MPRLFTYQDRTAPAPHERATCGCPLLMPTTTGASGPIADPHFAQGGCTTTLASRVGARIRHTLAPASAAYKECYARRTIVERATRQAGAPGITRPGLRRGRAIANQNTLPEKPHPPPGDRARAAGV